MDKSNVIKMEEAIPSFLSELMERSQASKVSRILEVAKQRGRISTAEIAQLLPARVMKDREMFSFFVSQLGEYLKTAKLGLSREAQIVDLGERRKHREEGATTLRSTGRKVVVVKDKTAATRPKISQIGETESEDLSDESALNEGGSSSFSGGTIVDQPLSDVEQIELANVYLNDPLAQYYREVNQYRLLNDEEVGELSRRIREDHDLDARNELVCHNLRLVRWVARRFVWSEIPFADLIQEGNLGLIKAAEMFDSSLGNKFSTYAQWWVFQFIQRAVMNQSNVIRIPVHLQEFRFKILNATEEIASETGRVPTPEAVASYTGLPLSKVTSTLKAMHLFARYSLNDLARRDEEGVATFQDLLIDEGADDPSVTIEAKEELVAAYQDLRVILKAVEELPGDQKRNLKIFKEMHGLNDEGTRKTLEEVGVEVGVTRERIRQILAKIFLQLSDRGIEVNQDALKDHLWRVQELEKFIGGSPLEL